MKKDTSDSGGRLSVEQSIELTAQSLNAYLPNYDTAVFSFSGGKDSTATAIVAEHLFSTGQVKRPKNLICIYADTRMELPPLQIAAKETMAELARRGWDCRTAVADLDNRFLVYMLGRGVAPPTNHFRWCTDRIKLTPMANALKDVRTGLGAGEKILMVTGVRHGESAVRDERIAVSCSKSGSECGQGWFQAMTDDRTDTVAPILHWRVCKVWELLEFWAPSWGFPSASMVSQAYGGDERLEENARTGCIGCPLVSRDLALEGVIALPEWEYLAPLARMKTLFTNWREDYSGRLQKPGIEVHKTKTEYTNRKGPLIFEARRKGLADILAIQAEINEAAERLGRPKVDMLNEEEVARIRQLIQEEKWPNKWDGTEPSAAKLMPKYYKDGSCQLVLDI